MIFINEILNKKLLISSLKGISQVMLIENAVSGLIMLLAITISSVSLGFVAFLSSIIGTIVGKAGGADEESVNQGLFGYNAGVMAGLIVYLAI